jgi:hypothetical protein
VLPPSESVAHAPDHHVSSADQLASAVGTESVHNRVDGGRQIRFLSHLVTLPLLGHVVRRRSECGEGLLDDVETLMQQVFGNDQRRQEAQHVAVGAGRQHHDASCVTRLCNS